MSALICGSFAYDNIMVFKDQFKNHILKSKEFTDSQKQQFKASRKKTQIDRVGSSDITVQQKPFIKTKAGQNGFTEVEVKKPKEIAELPLDVLTHNSAQTHLTVPVLKEIAKNDNWSADDKAKLKQYIKNNGAIMNQEFDDYFKTSKAIDEFGN